MARSLFIDTWAWVTLRDKGEARHQEVSDFYRRFASQSNLAYTTDYVLVETYTILFKRLPFVHAKASVEMIDAAVKRGVLKIEWMTSDRFVRVKALRLRLQDKPTISFADLSSMVVMNELGLSEILTEDEHFMHVGMGLQRVP